MDLYTCVFFCSSRRRHTRYWRDWSSDVCSSDLDPLNLWETPPFEPKIATLPDGRKVISARGACDDKGQVMTFIEACRAWKAVTGSLPIGITFLIEGAEEDGSKKLPEFVAANKDELKADVVLVC